MLAVTATSLNIKLKLMYKSQPTVSFEEFLVNILKFEQINETSETEEKMFEEESQVSHDKIFD